MHLLQHLFHKPCPTAHCPFVSHLLSYWSSFPYGVALACTRRKCIPYTRTMTRLRVHFGRRGSLPHNDRTGSGTHAQLSKDAVFAMKQGQMQIFQVSSRSRLAFGANFGDSCFGETICNVCQQLFQHSNISCEAPNMNV